MYKSVDTSTITSLFNEDQCFMYGGRKYERLFNHPDFYRFRVITSDESYEYVTDSDMDAELFQTWKMKAVKQRS